MTAGAATRSSPQTKALVRGEPVIRRVLDAAVHELGRVGYASLRVEDVAARAKVNKTSVYRRWSTKEALVRAALLSIIQGDENLTLPDTGSVRDDLLIVARKILATWSSPAGRVIVQVLAAEQPTSELSIIARSIQETSGVVPRMILERARERGELGPDADPALLVDILRASCRDAFTRPKGLTETFVTRVVDVLLVGSLSARGRRAASRA